MGSPEAQAGSPDMTGPRGGWMDGLWHIKNNTVVELCVHTSGMGDQWVCWRET